MAIFHEYDDYDGLGLAELIRRGDVSPDDLLDTAMARVTERNPKINAFASLFEARARGDIRAGLPAGPFCGVPFALKDLFMHFKGEVTGNGSRFWDGAVATHDSELFARYRRAGFAIFGKTTTSQLGLGPATETRAYGVTRNPWDLGRTSGGSSGGAAAVVAAGILPLAHASDSGGSTRIPASCCGLFGLKPTRGRMPMGPDRGESSGGLGSAHAVTRTVRDSAALLDATAGSDLGAPYGIMPPQRPWLDEVGAKPGRLRIAVWNEPPEGVVVHQDCIRALEDAAALCRDLGHVVDIVPPAVDMAALDRNGVVVLAASTRLLIEARASELGRSPGQDDLEPAARTLWEAAGNYSALDYANAIAAYHRAGRQLAAFQSEWDLILTPTLAQPPVEVGTITTSDVDSEGFRPRSRAFNPFCSLANRTGVPACSVPLYWNSADLPIGVQFMARFGDEATLFQIASQLEQARPWSQRSAPL
ncbi:amidase [Bordetella sp. BOR01]|uniref:amidase n=1 Tax=Bordetella sp. BOR01 TaxID=2854779 RepID=UPI001C4544D0|nr:amidase [Bordetella sp. BOR01]MBV7482103.1 amidase [Bordetella sp. BOR01]